MTTRISSEEYYSDEEKDDDKSLDDKDDKQKQDELFKWTEKVKEKYDNLHKVVSDNLPNLWDALEFALSIKTILGMYSIELVQQFSKDIIRYGNWSLISFNKVDNVILIMF